MLYPKSSGPALLASSLKISFSPQCDGVEFNLDDLHKLQSVIRGGNDQHIVGKNESKFVQEKICREKQIGLLD